MAVKSIIDIDVDDAKFQAFTKKFEAYRAAVKKLPGAWKESEKASESMAENFASMTAAMMAQNDLQKESLRHQRAAGINMRGMVRDSAQVAKNIGGATLNLLKWVGIGGLLGGAGLFGIGNLAGAVGNQRRSALGLGITTGQQASFGVAYNRFVDTNSVLGNIADAKGDYSRRWAFSAMGVNPDGRDPAELGAEMLIKAKQIFDKSGGSAQEAKARGLLEIFTMEDLRRLHNTSMKELRERGGAYRGGISELSRRDEINKKWQDFSDQLKNAGYRVQGLFVNTLGKDVVPALERLSKSAIKTLSTLVANGDFERGVKSVATGIEKFARHVGTPEFQKSVKEFASDVVAVAKGIRKALELLGLVDGPDPMGLTSARAQHLGVTPENARRVMAGNQGAAMKTLMSWGGVDGRGWSRNAAAGIIANLWAESKLDPFAVGDGGKAFGIAQWHPARQKEYERLFGHTMQSVKDRDQAYREQLGFVNWELTKGSDKMARYAGRAIAAGGSSYDTGAIVSRYYERPKLTETEAHNRGRSAMALDVIVRNSTGAQVAVQGAQVAQ